MRPASYIAIIATVLALATASTAGEAGFKLIVNPDNPVSAVDRDFLRDAYLKKATEWSNGETVRPLDLDSRFPARDDFRREVVKKTASQLKSYWNQQIFSGKGVPPPEADSTADAIAYVLANPGAVGYLPVDVDPGRAKVIGLR